MDINKKILLIGGAGFIGTSLLQKLKEYNHEIGILDNFQYDQPTKHYSNCQVIKDDIKNIKKYKNYIQSYDYILYMSSPRLYQLNSKEDVSKQLEYLNTTLGMLESQKFYFFSSCSVYGNSDELCYEHSPTNISSYYSELKVRGEELVESLYKNFTVLRFSTLFGNGIIKRDDLLINSLIKDIKTTKLVNIYDEQAWRPNLHINDCVSLVSNLISKSIQNTKINVGFNSLNTTKKHLIKNIKKSSSFSFKTEYTATKDPRSYRVSFDLLEKTIPIRPKLYEEYLKEDFFT